MFLNSVLDGTILLTKDNFTSIVRESNEMWLVAFVDPKSSIKSEWNKAALELNGKVKMGKVQSEVISENLPKLYSVASFPTILYFPEGDKSDPNTFEKYEGAITAKDIVSWAFKKHEGEPIGKYRLFYLCCLPMDLGQ